MDISFSTSVGGEAWSLHECAKWAQGNRFDAIRLATNGIAEPDRVLSEGPNEIKSILKNHGVYLAALSAHNNLLDDNLELAEAAADRLDRKSVV